MVHEAFDVAVIAQCLVFDNRVKLFQEIARALRAELLAQAGEAGEIDEQDRRILLHGLQQKPRIFRKRIGDGRRLEAPKRFALYAHDRGAHIESQIAVEQSEEIETGEARARFEIAALRPEKCRTLKFSSVMT